MMMANMRCNAQDWQRIIQEAESDPHRSVQRYCDENKLNTKTYYSWRKKLGLNDQTNKSKFVQLNHLAPTQWIVITTPDGLRIELPINTNENCLQQIINAVRPS
jgi:hypothetical protein